MRLELITFDEGEDVVPIGGEKAKPRIFIVERTYFHPVISVVSPLFSPGVLQDEIGHLGGEIVTHYDGGVVDHYLMIAVSGIEDSTGIILEVIWNEVVNDHRSFLKVLEYGDDVLIRLFVPLQNLDGGMLWVFARRGFSLERIVFGRLNSLLQNVVIYELGLSSFTPEVLVFLRAVDDFLLREIYVYVEVDFDLGLNGCEGREAVAAEAIVLVLDLSDLSLIEPVDLGREL